MLKEVNRREFLIKMAAVAGVGMFPGLPFGEKLPPKYYSTELPVPEKMHGIDVYGAEKRLTTGQQAALYNFFDKAFDDGLTPGQRSMGRWDQRRTSLPSGVRNLEEIVARDIYNEFEKRRIETGVGFAEYLKMHVDLLNRMIDQAGIRWAEWSVPISVKLLRIIVSEGLDFYNPRDLQENKDTDARWVTDDLESDFWSTDFDADGNLIMRKPPGNGKIEKAYVLPKKDDSLVKKEIWIDMALIHELMHRLLNVPDEYVKNVEKSPFRFGGFNLDSGIMGGDNDPSISPYILAVLKRNYDRKIRGYFTDPLAMGVLREGWGKDLDRMPFWEVPPQINFSAEIAKTPYRGTVSVFKNEFEHGFKFGIERYYQKKIWPREPDYQGVDKIVFRGPVFQERTTCPTDYLIRFGDKEIFVPVSIFNMTHWAIQTGLPEYKISFTGYENYAKQVQTMEYVHENDLSQYLASHDRIYATLGIVGSPYCAVYSL